MANRFKKAREYTEKYKNVLLPCRICENKNIIISSERTIFPSKNAWSVNCTTKNCDCTGLFLSVKEAVNKWNEMQKRDNETIKNNKRGEKMNRYFKVIEIDAYKFINATGEDLDCCQLVVPTNEAVYVAVDEDDEDEIQISLDCFCEME